MVTKSRVIDFNNSIRNPFARLDTSWNVSFLDLAGVNHICIIVEGVVQCTGKIQSRFYCERFVRTLTWDGVCGILRVRIVVLLRKVVDGGTVKLRLT